MRRRAVQRAVRRRYGCHRSPVEDEQRLRVSHMAEHHLAHEPASRPRDLVAAVADDVYKFVGPVEGEPRRAIVRIGIPYRQPAERAQAPASSGRASTPTVRSAGTVSLPSERNQEARTDIHNNRPECSWPWRLHSGQSSARRLSSASHGSRRRH